MRHDATAENAQTVLVQLYDDRVHLGNDLLVIGQSSENHAPDELEHGRCNPALEDVLARGGV